METKDTKPTLEKVPEAIKNQSLQLERLERLLINQAKPQSIIPSKRYTLPEAAEYCRMAVPTFRTYLSKRKISGIKFGKSWVFTHKDLEKFLQSYRVKTAEEINLEASDYLISKR